MLLFLRYQGTLGPFPRQVLTCLFLRFLPLLLLRILFVRFPLNLLFQPASLSHHIPYLHIASQTSSRKKTSFWPSPFPLAGLRRVKPRPLEPSTTSPLFLVEVPSSERGFIILWQILIQRDSPRKERLTNQLKISWRKWWTRGRGLVETGHAFLVPIARSLVTAKRQEENYFLPGGGTVRQPRLLVILTTPMWKELLSMFSKIETRIKIWNKLEIIIFVKLL